MNKNEIKTIKTKMEELDFIIEKHIDSLSFHLSLSLSR